MMNNIERWIERFTSAWLNYDVAGMMKLFSEDVEYWETPFQKFANKTELVHAWGYIHKQKNISLNTELIGENLVKWDLRYILDNQKKHWGGVYVVRFDESRLRNYFWQCGEEEGQ